MDELISLRRQLHALAEPGWCEFKTTMFIIKYLSSLNGQIHLAKDYINKDFMQGRDEKLIASFKKNALGIDDELLSSLEGYTGCIWELRGEKWDDALPTVAYRFDIDCVCVNESKDEAHLPFKEGFASTHDGYMHACAHDGHISIGLKLASFLSSQKASLKARYLLIFQAAEEGVMGAMSVAKSQLFKGVDYFLAAHLSLCAKSGEVVLNPENFLASCKYEAHFKGRPSHAGTAPQKGANALAAAAVATTQLLALPRHSDGITRVNVGYLRAGRANNVIPDDAIMGFELRGSSDEICEFLEKMALKTIKACASMHEVEVQLEPTGRAYTLENSELLVELLRKSSKGLSQVEKRDFNASEDASCFFKELKKGASGLYFIIGANRVGEHHQGVFDFDESALFDALKVFKDLSLGLEKSF